MHRFSPARAPSALVCLTALVVVCGSCLLQGTGTGHGEAGAGGSRGDGGALAAGGAASSSGEGGASTATTGQGGATASSSVASTSVTAAGSGGAGGQGASPVCGNATVETGEECDDGNGASGDGCSATCMAEAEDDYCPGEAVTVDQAGVTLTGDTTGKALKGSASCGGLSAPDVIYQVTPAVDGALVAVLSAQFSAAIVYLRTTCPAGAELACGTTGAPSSFVKVVKAGQPYTLFVDGNGGTEGAFSLSLSLLACGNGIIDPGEECDDANDLTGDGCAGCVVECGCGAGCAGAVEWKDPVTHHCYRLVTSPNQGWDAALLACQAWGGDLAALTTQAEIDVVAPLIAQADGDTWLGGNDLLVENQFAWSSGEAWLYTNKAPPWNTNEPNDSFGEDCVEIYKSALLNDEDCGASQDYLCERGTVGQ